MWMCSDQEGKGPCVMVPLAWKMVHQSLCRMLRNGRALKISKSLKKAENGPLVKISSQSLDLCSICRICNPCLFILWPNSLIVSCVGYNYNCILHVVSLWLSVSLCLEKWFPQKKQNNHLGHKIQVNVN